MICGMPSKAAMTWEPEEMPIIKAPRRREVIIMLSVATFGIGVSGVSGAQVQTPETQPKLCSRELSEKMAELARMTQGLSSNSVVDFDELPEIAGADRIQTLDYVRSELRQDYTFVD